MAAPNLGTPQSIEVATAVALRGLVLECPAWQEIAGPATANVVVGLYPAPANGEAFTADELLSLAAVLTIEPGDDSEMVVAPDSGTFGEAAVGFGLFCHLRRFVAEGDRVGDGEDLYAWFWDRTAKLAAEIVERSLRLDTLRPLTVKRKGRPVWAQFAQAAGQGQFLVCDYAISCAYNAGGDE